MIKTILLSGLLVLLTSCRNDNQSWEVKVYETSAAGKKLEKVESFKKHKHHMLIKLDDRITYQTITGIGGSFTESSAYLLNQMGDANREKIINAYFSDEGARYSLTRTHINSCDFSLGQYAYVTDPNDKTLESFSIDEDRDDIVPMIKEAMDVSSEGFRIIASPWTAPPWMKDNNDWVGGRLLPEYYEVWALYFAKYIEAYKEEGIDIWAVTVENEPLGNGSNWESMHFTAEEMIAFIRDHLGPVLEKNGLDSVHIFGYDQNRDELKHWVDVMYDDTVAAQYIDGTAIHWYASTYEVFPEVLQYAHFKAPDKYLIETEGCVDAEVPQWQDDALYWSKEATDWGWDWASEEQKHLHPKYVPVYRYARDIIGCLNNYVDGWVDWNMVLDRQGGPNWFKNWCVAPVIVDPQNDEVYLTPLYYTMSHFSKFIRPGAKKILVEPNDDSVLVTAVSNPDRSIAIVMLNPNEYPVSIDLEMPGFKKSISLDAQAVSTVVLKDI